MEPTFDLAKILENGGVFALAVLMLTMGFKKLDDMNDKLLKILTFITILVKTNTSFNGVEKVLDKDGEGVARTILEAELGEK